MKTIIAALALLTLFGFTDRPQQTNKNPNEIVITDGFAARPRIIVVRQSPYRTYPYTMTMPGHFGDRKDVKK